MRRHMQQRLVLVRHSSPLVRIDRPASEWPLSEQGVRRVRELASVLDAERVRAVYSSPEPKALETAMALGSLWHVPVQAIDGLHEHDRSNVPLLTSVDFEHRLRESFDRPFDVVFGRESAEAARRRFSAAVMRLLMTARDDVVVVTHGTVLTLFVAAATGLAPYAFWRRLDTPCAVTLTLPDLRLAGITYVTGGLGRHSGRSDVTGSSDAADFAGE